MGLKETVLEHLRHADDAALEELMSSHPGALRHTFGRLWDTDPMLRRRAAVATGMGAAAHPAKGRELIRQAMWALNDESATNGVFVIPALGEIGVRAPELMAPFVQPMGSYLWDHGLRQALLRALDRIARAAPELAGPIREVVEESMNNEGLVPAKVSGAPDRDEAADV